MKANYLFLTFVFCCGIGFAQTKEDLSPEEQERRQKNIEAGNPFKEFGYMPKIATLSKGRYLEFHDLDSIVKIGSFSFHVKKKQVTGYTRIDPNDLESGLSPEVISRWLSPDPLAEEYPDWTPYRYGFNNPVRYTDPTGLLEWDPQVNEDGSTSYFAEAGDSAKTLASQYGLDQSTAEAITGTTGDTKIAEGTEVSGGKVKEVTGSEVLKLDLNSEMATEQRVFDQFLFARDHSSLKGEFGFYTTEYYGNVFSQENRIKEGFANLNVEGRNIPVRYGLPLYETKGAFFNVKQYSYFLSNNMVSDKKSYGNVFGNTEALNHTYLPLYLSFGNGKSNLVGQGNYTISTPNENMSSMRKKFKN